jgi:predicted DCC family thiol-disulfide oxidoreductase YuxK
MRHVLVFDGDCAACSRAAQAVARMDIAGLEVRSWSDPAVLALLREAGLEEPDGPALLSGEGAQAQLATGWAMRRQLARLMGWRRATRIVRLVSIEGRARVARAARAGAISRRGVLGTGLAAAAGALGSLLLPDVASAATSPSPAGVTPASDAELQTALASASVQRAIGTWGPATAAGVVHDGKTSVLVLAFTNTPEVALLVDNAAGLPPGSRLAVAVQKDPAHGTLSFFGTDGAPFGSLSVSSGRVVVHEAPAIPTGIPTWRIRCFIACLGAHLSAQCILTCHTCVTTWNPWSRAISCFHCLVCAGPEAIRCARHCFL